jgi:hypothetical protein
MLCPFIVAAVFAGWATAAAAASPARSPDPVAGEPSCNGLILASFNHDTIGPSGNATSSSGPGSFFHQDTHQAIEELARDPNC